MRQRGNFWPPTGLLGGFVLVAVVVVVVVLVVGIDVRGVVCGPVNVT